MAKRKGKSKKRPVVRMKSASRPGEGTTKQARPKNGGKGGRRRKGWS